MSVNKGLAEIYRIRNRSDWGHFYVSEWHTGSGNDERYGGELVAHTSFGTYGYAWSHCGLPFKEFLLDVGFDYFMQKAAPPGRYKRYDAEASVKRMREAICERRREGGLRREDARAIFDALPTADSDAAISAESLVNAWFAVERMGKFSDTPYDYLQESVTADARGFWHDLWPQLLQVFREELAATSAPTLELA